MPLLNCIRILQRNRPICKCMYTYVCIHIYIYICKGMYILVRVIIFTQSTVQMLTYPGNILTDIPRHDVSLLILASLNSVTLTHKINHNINLILYGNMKQTTKRMTYHYRYMMDRMMIGSEGVRNKAEERKKRRRGWYYQTPT